MADNRQLVHRWFEEVWNQHREDAIDELFAPDGVAHGLGDEALRGAEGFKQFHRAYCAAFPDIHITVDDLIADGDRIACRFSGTATHSGDGFGVSATQKPVRFSGMSLTRWRNGQIVEGWNVVDLDGIMRQIGALVPRR